ncbi:MAG TPA: rod shape-determining protein MreD [Candidatus Sulfotelmatobacter sp.]|nr:rod shape-determining protein MreD [Candidatus Sulfotelmatobacter sp.]
MTLWFFPSLLLCAVAQVALLGPLTLAGVCPDLFLLLVFLLSPGCHPEAATLQGFLIGLCQDALSGGPLGLRAFTYSLLAFLAARLSRNLQTEKPFAQFWLLLTGCGAAGALALLLLSFFLGPPPLLPTLAWVIVPEALYTAVVGFLILAVPRAWATLVLWS